MHETLALAFFLAALALAPALSPADAAAAPLPGGLLPGARLHF